MEEKIFSKQSKINQRNLFYISLLNMNDVLIVLDSINDLIFLELIF